jgi:hypothetical protein
MKPKNVDAMPAISGYVRSSDVRGLFGIWPPVAKLGAMGSYLVKIVGAGVSPGANLVGPAPSVCDFVTRGRQFGGNCAWREGGSREPGTPRAGDETDRAFLPFAGWTTEPIAAQLRLSLNLNGVASWCWREIAVSGQRDAIGVKASRRIYLLRIFYLSERV